MGGKILRKKKRNLKAQGGMSMIIFLSSVVQAFTLLETSQKLTTMENITYIFPKKNDKKNLNIYVEFIFDFFILNC
jgi:hypothetical protein